MDTVPVARQHPKLEVFSSRALKTPRLVCNLLAEVILKPLRFQSIQTEFVRPKKKKGLKASFSELQIISRNSRNSDI